MPVIAGPCIIESEGFALEVAQECKRQLEGLSIDFYFKASFDKANRTSIDSFRGPGLQEGLKILDKVKSQVGVKIFTDFHTPEQAERVSEVVDFIQIPAFLCRQTDMITAATTAVLKYKKKLNIKKGQFLAPWDSEHLIEKVRKIAQRRGAELSKPAWFFMTERGSSFGYNNLIVDMISFECIKQFGVPVLYDATHSIQRPSGGNKNSAGRREYLECLTRAALAAGASGLFLECHPDPVSAKSDAATAFYLEHLRTFIEQCLKIYETVYSLPKLLPESQAQNNIEKLNL